jgi:predicted RNA-binding protein YlxR (DUF448 family)
VRTADGVKIDLSGKLPGRGAYLHENRSCWEQGLKHSLARALKIELSPQDVEYLKSFLTSLPEKTPVDDLEEEGRQGST